MSKNVKSKEELVAAGLGYIFSNLNYMNVLDDFGKKHAQLERHPFGLEIDPSIHCQTITLVAFPGYSDVSYESMIAHIRWAVAGTAPRDGKPRKLRIIKCADDRTGDKNAVYFEIQTFLGTFICGGCNDYSGAGGSAKSIMDCVFALLSAVYGVEIETVNIPFPQSKKMEKGLVDAYNKWRYE